MLFSQENGIPVPAPRQLKWHEAEMGVVFHYDLHVFDGQVYGQGNNRINPVEDYNIFNPEHLDTDQWIRAAKAAGAKFAILTATHETGFGLWQSDVNPYCLKAVRWRDGKGDIPEYPDRGVRLRAICAAGKQDVAWAALTPTLPGAEMIGASSDHLIVDVEDCAGQVHVGDWMDFRCGYMAVLDATTSAYVEVRVRTEGR